MAISSGSRYFLAMRCHVLSRSKYRFRHRGSLSTLPANAGGGGIGPFLFSPLSHHGVPRALLG
eukprot:2371342-Prorocentrum_lima.AAC.1